MQGELLFIIIFIQRAIALLHSPIGIWFAARCNDPQRAIALMG